MNYKCIKKQLRIETEITQAKAEQELLHIQLMNARIKQAIIEQDKEIERQAVLIKRKESNDK